MKMDKIDEVYVYFNDEYISKDRQGFQWTARSLKRATVLTFPNTGHGAFQSEPCASSIAAAFVANPEVAPSSACTAGLGPPRFIPRGELLRVPVFGELLTAPGRDRTTESTALGIALLLLLSGLLLLPLGWLARTVLKKHHPSLKPPLEIGRASCRERV